MSDGTQIIKLGDQEIILDSNRLCFNEATLSTYMEQEAVWYDYFGILLWFLFT
jgi:hypothetical protein